MATESVSYELMVGAGQPLEQERTTQVGKSSVWSPQMEALFGGLPSQSGKRVTTLSALTYSPVWAAVDILSNDVSKLPMQTWRWNEDFTERTLARQHPTWERFRRRTGEGLTANEWRGMMMAQALLHGRGHSVVHWQSQGRFWLEFLRASQVVPDRIQGERIYRITRDRHNIERLPIHEIKFENEMFNINGLTLDHWGGLNLVAFARNTIGRFQSTEEYTDDFFQNDGVPSGVLQFPQELSDDEKARVMQVWEAIHTGGGKRHRIFPIDNGGSFSRSAVTPEEAVLVDLMKLGPQDVARFFRIPGYKLGIETNVSYNSNEQEQKDYLNETLAAWLVKFEEQAHEKCLTEPVKRSERIQIEFDLSQLLRADFKTHLEANSIAVQSGQKSPNEARADLKLGPYDGGDTRYVQSNLVAVGESPAEPEPAAPPEMPAERSRVVDALRQSFHNGMARMVSRVARGAMRHTKSSTDMAQHIDSWHDRHLPVVVDTVREVAPVAEAMGIDLDVDKLSVEFLARCRRLVLELSEYDQSLSNLAPSMGVELESLSREFINDHGMSDDARPDRVLSAG